MAFGLGFHLGRQQGHGYRFVVLYSAASYNDGWLRQIETHFDVPTAYELKELRDCHQLLTT